jgi:lipopolysaccharide transport system permease protein
LPWTFFANAVSNSSNSLVGSANLITKVYFPRLIVPCAAVLARLLDLAIGFAVLGVLLACYGMDWSWRMLLLPYLVFVLAVLAAAVGMLMSALNVKYRDVGHALPFLIQLGMFATPIIYPASMVQGKWRWVLVLNPLTGIVEGFRAALFTGRSFDWTALGLSSAIAGALLFCALYSFRRMETRFADVI